MAKQDYYETLGVARDADEKAIKKAYKRLAMKYHPDRNQGDKAAAEKFKEINEAYSILSDAEKRAQYDRFGHNAFEGGGFQQASGGFEDVFSQFGGFGDIFGDIFGNRNHKRGPTRGEDLRYQVNITLEEAALGSSKDIKINTMVTCEHCHGSGAEQGSKIEKCPTCHGNGIVRVQQGPFITEQECPTCHGSGKKIEKKCKHCKGIGRVHKAKELTVKIPAGVDTGNQLRLQGEGSAGEPGADAGDLYILIHVQEHDIFKRDGFNLYCDVPVSFTLAALGGKIEAPTLTGGIELTIPPETQTGRILRVPKKGVMRGSQIGGDLLCRITVETPVNLTTEQKELLTKFEESIHTEKQHNPKSTSFFTKVKKYFEKRP